jgi:diguanylate cyclase (GGDEF)-like protein/PAS domain S-box-containing protein
MTKPEDTGATGETAAPPPSGTDVASQLHHDEQVTFLRELLDSATEAIIAHTLEGEICFFNEAACHLLGYSSEEMASVGGYAWVGPKDRPQAPARIEAIVHQGQLRFQSTAERKDGSIVPTEVHTRRVETTTGAIIVAAMRDISERVEAQRTILHLAYHDALTGLANRALFEDHLKMAMANARRHGDLLGIAHVDIDGFRPINDTYGHASGDAVLVTLAQRLEKCCRAEDTVGRLGDDEYVLLLPRIKGEDDLRVIGEKLASTIAEPVTIDGNEVRMTGSVGLAVYEHEHDSARSLLTKADAAMYCAKQLSGRRWCIYEPGMFGPTELPDDPS